MWRRCGVEDSVRALAPDFSGAPSSAEHLPRPTTAILTPITDPTTAALTPIMGLTTDPTPDTDIRSRVIAIGTGMTGNSVVAIDQAREGRRGRLPPQLCIGVLISR